MKIEDKNNSEPDDDMPVEQKPLSLNSIQAIDEYLAAQGGGTSISEPIVLTLAIDLGNMTSQDSDWQQLLGIIATADKYVKLDLSACTMSGTEFNSNTGNGLGKLKILELILPDKAQSIGASGFNGFNALKSVSGSGITDIGDSAFWGCTSLESVTLGSNAPQLGANILSPTGGREITVYVPVGATGYDLNWQTDFLKDASADTTVKIVYE